MWFLCRLVGRNVGSLQLVTCIGVTLVITGGFLKATWKLLWVTTGMDFGWMSAGLFWCMGPGFVLLAGSGVALFRASKGHTAGRFLKTLPGLLALAGVTVAAAGMVPAKILTLAMTVMGSMTLMISLIMLSSRRGAYASAWLLAANIAITFVLSGLARIEDQTAALQWIEEWLNLFAQGSFALALMWLWRQQAAQNDNNGT